MPANVQKRRSPRTKTPRNSQPQRGAPMSTDEADASTAANPFLFMKLQLELRIMVFKELLACSPTLHLPRFHHIGPAGSRPKIVRGAHHSPSATCRLFLVSKAFYHEAMPIYFGCNTFQFLDADHLRSLQNLTPDRRRLIRSIAFALEGYALAKSIKVLHSCVSLRRLTLIIEWPALIFDAVGSPEYKSLLRGAGIKDLLRIRGIKELTVDTSLYPEEKVDPEIGWDALNTALQVLKQPRSAASLRFQNAKDYPRPKAERTVFGKANVTTRAERRMIEANEKTKENVS